MILQHVYFLYALIYYITGLQHYIVSSWMQTVVFTPEKHFTC